MSGLDGENNTINLAGASDEVVINGSGNSVTVAGAANASIATPAAIAPAASTRKPGGGGGGSFYNNSVTLTGNANSIVVGLGASGNSIQGNCDVCNVNLEGGSGNVITFTNASGDEVSIYSGDRNTVSCSYTDFNLVDVYGDDNQVTLDGVGGEFVTVNGGEIYPYY